MSSRAMKRKVLLMGKSGSGKTSMRSIIFANYLARDTMRLGPTLGVENSNVRFLGQLILNLWDCGGQDSFIENYFTSQHESIFRNVELLIYVFDIESKNKVFVDNCDYFEKCLTALKRAASSSLPLGTGARHRRPKVFCLIHKMDLIESETDRAAIFEAKKKDIMSRIESHLPDIDFMCYPTSIWDETLYKAWSAIVHSLIPNINILESYLASLCSLINATEIVLFERATFLVISSSLSLSLSPIYSDAHRYEKISNIMKQFKLSCSKLNANFSGMEMRNESFSAYIDQLTSHTYIMCVESNYTTIANVPPQPSLHALASSPALTHDSASASSSSHKHAEHDHHHQHQFQHHTHASGDVVRRHRPMISEAVKLNLLAARPHFEAFLSAFNAS